MNTNELIEQQLGIPGLFTKGLYDKYGAWWAGRKLLRVIWQKKPAVLQDCTFDPRTLPFNDAAKDVTWRRDLEPDMIGRYVHHLDKNSQYLSADRGLYTGYGDPVHVADGDDDTYIEPKLPGIYRVSNVSNNMSTFDNCGFPAIIKPGQEWVTKDVLIFAQKHGYSFHIDEAWVFPTYTRVLDEWAKRIWDARAAAKAVDEQLYRKMKMIAIMGNGAWATNAETHPGLDLIHPNWWADTVGAARVKLLANLLKYGAPVLIETDGLYYIKADPDPRTAVHDMDGVSIMAREHESGGYKHKGSFMLTEAVYEQARNLDALKLADLFKGEIKKCR